jgi:CubicO group peptidase (beta-lactamase class C family)
MTLVIALATAALACSSLNGQELPSEPAEQAGFSREALARIGARIQKHIDENRITGATGLIARHGKVVYFETYGAMDRESRKPMPRDAILYQRPVLLFRNQHIARLFRNSLVAQSMQKAKHIEGRFR